MLQANFRPWGSLGWVLDRLPVTKWSVLGCLGTEERCLGLWEVICGRGAQDVGLFVDVADPESRFTPVARAIKERRAARLRAIQWPSLGVEPTNLLTRDSDIVRLATQFSQSGKPNVILDISCFPKRFFFPFVRLMLASAEIENLLVTYTVPAGYYTGALAEDHEPLGHLPLFGASIFPEPPIQVAFVGVGFTPLGLATLLEPYDHRVSVKLLFPFPPGPPAFQRNWRFISELKKSLPPASARDPIRIAAYDVPNAFSHILNETTSGTRSSVFAPYGPKPISLAMCIYATLTKAAVFYTQPRVYRPDYSAGIKQENGLPVIYAYCLMPSGRSVYSL